MVVGGRGGGGGGSVRLRICALARVCVYVCVCGGGGGAGRSVCVCVRVRARARVCVRVPAWHRPHMRVHMQRFGCSYTLPLSQSDCGRSRHIFVCLLGVNINKADEIR